MSPAIAPTNCRAMKSASGVLLLLLVLLCGGGAAAALAGCDRGSHSPGAPVPLQPSGPSATPVLVPPVPGDARAGADPANPTSTPPVAAATLPVAAPRDAPHDVRLARGMAVYQKQCSACHGPTGLGDGSAAYLLYPKPRNFSTGNFRITSTRTGMPTPDDLVNTLRRGMPGSAMPGFAHLPEQDLLALADVVRQLAIDGHVADQRSREPDRTREKALELALGALNPGPPVRLPPRPTRTDPHLGKQLYDATCAACHGADGTGQGVSALKDSLDYPISARDFTKGIFKGGADEQALATRIFRGMPGTPMPGAEALKPDELWSLVAYVQTMIKQDAQQRVLQSQKTLVAKRVAGPLSPDPAGAQWNAAGESFLPLMPLWWRDDRVEGVTVQAVHDGKDVALRLTWADRAKDDTMLTTQSFGDGAALQLSADPEPPFFAMGDKDAAVDIWHFKAPWQRDLASGGPPTLRHAYPHLPAAGQDVPSDDSFLTARTANNPVAQAAHGSLIESSTAKGFGTLTSRGTRGSIRGGAAWSDGKWRVTFVQKLGALDQGEVPLAPGRTISVAVAVWDGQAGDRNGQKSVTIWHKLQIEK